MLKKIPVHATDLGAIFILVFSINLHLPTTLTNVVQLQP